jgi:hypothetical protein
MEGDPDLLRRTPRRFDDAVGEAFARAIASGGDPTLEVIEGRFTTSVNPRCPGVTRSGFD